MIASRLYGHAADREPPAIDYVFPFATPHHNPAHDPLKVGTLAAILTDVATYLKIIRDELLQKLFG